jgi:hypothetical protein
LDEERLRDFSASRRAVIPASLPPGPSSSTDDAIALDITDSGMPEWTDDKCGNLFVRSFVRSFVREMIGKGKHQHPRAVEK